MAELKDTRTITVDLADDGQRLDRWLKKAVPDLPYALSQKLIRKGAIRIDGKRAKADARLSAGQNVRIPPVEDKGDLPAAPKRKLTDEDRRFIQSLVIYDDGDVIAFNKPSGLASQGGGGVEHHIDALFPLLADNDGLAPRLIHRLDRDTSGVLLAARSAEAVRNLGKSFKDRRAKKIYWAITVPAPADNEGSIRAPIAKTGGAHKDRMVIDDEDGKGAVTDFAIIERAAKRAAFVAFCPRTGRTHQIRVHASDVLECPILGDGKYGGSDARLDGMEDALADRLHLHARRLVIHHPFKKEWLNLVAPLPPELRRSWDALGFDADDRSDPFEDH